MPHTKIHFDIAREKSKKAVEYAINLSAPIVCALQKSAAVAVPGFGDIYNVGVLAFVKQMLRLPDGSLRVLVEAEEKVEILGVVEQKKMLMAEVAPYEDFAVFVDEAERTALCRELRSGFKQYVDGARTSAEAVFAFSRAESLEDLAECISANISADYLKMQKLLECRNLAERAVMLVSLLAFENEIIELEREIDERVKERMDQNQRDYYMREQIKALREELGEDDGFDGESDKLVQKIHSRNLPDAVKETLVEEAGKLAKMQFGSAEGAVIRGYIETVLELPWDVETEDDLSLEHARDVLDREHYGLDKVKDRILEYIAVRKLAPELGGQVLLLVGPPGVGKTSIASSVAHALGRKFVRVSLGGISDEADVRGHRKTYIGSMPGRILNGLKIAGSKNPVMLLDEVDKMGRDHRGDPASALLEIFDVEQNSTFRDHFAELPFDLSKVIFIVTANTTDTVARPLLDRMEKIEIASYTDNEKTEIARRHLVPKQMKRHGIEQGRLTIPAPVIKEIIASYTRESGVRELERRITAICRKAALEIVGGEARVRVTKRNLPGFLGAPKYKNENLAKSDVGVANGLAWTAVGGESLRIEVTAIEGTGKLELTGSLGDVMKESAKAALTYIRSRADALGIDREFYKNKDIHIHVPEGAVPKDGPSAGITIATALISELCGVAPEANVAMTGEITLRGRVLPIGGLREKTMAALKNGFDTVIIPKDNLPDLEEIDQSVRENLHFEAAEYLDAVIRIAFGGRIGLKRPPSAKRRDREAAQAAPLQ